MKIITVNGGKPLSGRIRVSGSKNAALPIIFATLVTEGITTLHNVPDIGDVSVALELISGYGAELSRCGDTVTIDTRSLHPYIPPASLVSRIRASTYLIGSSLARFGNSEIQAYGGCSFADRPIDLHILAAECLGARSDGLCISAASLVGAPIYLPIPSVGATINAMIMASRAKGRTVIYNYAREPHVHAVADFLSGAGAAVTFSDSAITIDGTSLHGSEYTVIGDMIEAGSYLSLGLTTFSDIYVTGFDPEHISSFIKALHSVAEVVTDSDAISLLPLTSSSRFRVECLPYPRYPTDLGPLAAPIMARYSGGEITDRVFPTRFGYLRELSRLGITADVRFGGARIYPSIPHVGIADATDLRGGMALLVWALAAHGRSEIHSADNILRGYSCLVENLRSLGADIEIRDE